MYHHERCSSPPSDTFSNYCPGLQVGVDPVDHVIGRAFPGGELVQAGQGRLGQAQPGHGLLVARGSAAPPIQPRYDAIVVGRMWQLAGLPVTAGASA